MAIGKEGSTRDGDGFVQRLWQEAMHHEIYLSDARKVAPEKLKTVILHPIRRK